MPVDATTADPRITHRPVTFDFAEVPRYWWAGHPFPTHFANAVNLLFPSGERFFIRSVRHFEERLTDPALREQVKAFYAQEGAHSRNHELQLRLMESQGYDVRAILGRYERLAWGTLAPLFSPEMRLSVTVALEHYTAIMAENALTDHLLDTAHPVMRQLLLWHAAEEIEHKSVAFDVLAAVAPGYARRMAGMAIATLGLFGFWVMAFVMLARQERRLTGTAVRRPSDGPAELKERSVMRNVVLRGLRQYASRDFHPDDHDTQPLAQSFLAGAKLPVREASRRATTEADRAVAHASA